MSKPYSWAEDVKFMNNPFKPRLREGIKNSCPYFCNSKNALFLVSNQQTLAFIDCTKYYINLAITMIVKYMVGGSWSGKSKLTYTEFPKIYRKYVHM